MTHLRLNIWLYNSVTVSETKSAVFYSAFTSFGCLVNSDLMCPFRPQKQLSCSGSKQLLHFRLFCTYNFRNHFLTIHPVWSLWLLWRFILANALKQETVLLKGTIVLLLRSWITPSGVWTYDLLLAQMFYHYSLIRCEQLVTMSVTITIHHTASHHQSSVTFVNFCSPPQTRTKF